MSGIMVELLHFSSIGEQIYLGDGSFGLRFLEKLIFFFLLSGSVKYVKEIRAKTKLENV